MFGYWIWILLWVWICLLFAQGNLKCWLHIVIVGIFPQNDTFTQSLRATNLISSIVSLFSFLFMVHRDGRSSYFQVMLLVGVIVLPRKWVYWEKQRKPNWYYKHQMSEPPFIFMFSLQLSLMKIQNSIFHDLCVDLYTLHWWWLCWWRLWRLHALWISCYGSFLPNTPPIHQYGASRAKG